MNFFKRISNLWAMSKDPRYIPLELEHVSMESKAMTYAEFIRPNRVQDILAAKPDATLSDIIQDNG